VLSGRAPRAELSEPRRPGRHRRIETDEDLDSGVRFVLDLDDGPGDGRHSLDRDNRAAALDIASAGVLITEPGWAQAANTATVPAETARPVPPKPSRVGRNLPAAIGVGLALGAVIIASLLVYRPSFVFLVSLAVAYGIFELTRAIGTVEARPPLVPLVVGGVAMQAATWFRVTNGLIVTLLVTVCGVFIWRLGEGVAGYLRDVSASVLVLLYLPLLAGCAVLLAVPDDGAARVMAFVGTVVCSDTGGYAAGVLFGKHPLAPVVSKGKTWEGLAGSAIACALCGGLILSLTFHHPWWQGVVFGLAIAATATLGDLGESMIKRDLGLKDMGRLLPGHGGIMDRLDSLLPCAAVAYLLLSAFLGN
jgi:phosphatidate cytidylyltransferase